MQEQNDNQILVINGEFSAELEVKRSRFIATVSGEVDEALSLEFIKTIRKRYSEATHNCYAYIADEAGNIMRFSDDGEPGGTAGMPMLEVLKHKGIKKSIAVVTRYFGGIKLGAGGLVGAYTKAVTLAIDKAIVATKKTVQIVTVQCGFSDYSRLDKLLSSDYLKVMQIKFLDNVIITIAVCLSNVSKFISQIKTLTKGEAIIQYQEKKYMYF